jgi:hypothetical protein
VDISEIHCKWNICDVLNVRIGVYDWRNDSGPSKLSLANICMKPWNCNCVDVLFTSQHVSVFSLPNLRAPTSLKVKLVRLCWNIEKNSPKVAHTVLVFPYLCNQLITEGIFLEWLKYSKVKPL